MIFTFSKTVWEIIILLRFSCSNNSRYNSIVFISGIKYVQSFCNNDVNEILFTFSWHFCDNGQHSDKHGISLI